MNTIKKKFLSRGGFTLVELLVVIAIIGLLATLAVVSLQSARERARDTERISTIRNVQSGLELYYADNQTYPKLASDVQLGSATANTLCDITAGFGASADCTGQTIYMNTIDPDPLDTDENVYLYRGQADLGGTAGEQSQYFAQDFSITYYTEAGSSNGDSAQYAARANGVVASVGTHIRADGGDIVECTLGGHEATPAAPCCANTSQTTGDCATW